MKLEDVICEEMFIQLDLIKEGMPFYETQPKRVILKRLSHAIAERVRELVVDEEKLIEIIIKHFPCEDIQDCSDSRKLAKAISQQVRFK